MVEWLTSSIYKQHRVINSPLGGEHTANINSTEEKVKNNVHACTMLSLSCLCPFRCFYCDFAYFIYICKTYLAKLERQYTEMPISQDVKSKDYGTVI